MLLLGVLYSEPAMPRRKPGDPVVLFPCKICGRKFHFNSQLEQHLRHHAGVRPHACAVCGQRFALECSLNKHMTRHSSEKPLMCDTCGQQFAHINYLKSHQRCHSQDRPYSCQDCEKKFAHGTSLRHHVAVMHADAAGSHEQYSCHECGQSFPTMSQVRVHVRLHVTEESDDCVKCGKCGKTYVSAPSLKEHISAAHGFSTSIIPDTRRQYSCRMCERVFSQPGNLRRHVLTHTEQRPCECTVCGKRFSQPGNLKAHLRTHSGQRPYPCVGCGSAFSDSSTLRKHVLHHCYTMSAVSTDVAATADQQQATPSTLDTITVSTVLTDSVSCNADDIPLCSFV